MFTKKSIICILMLLLVLIVGLGVSSAADYGINDLEVNDTSTDLNVTLSSSGNGDTILDDENQALTESQVSDNSLDDTTEDTSHSHSTLSSVHSTPVSYALSPIYDLVTSIDVLKQNSNYLNYTIMVLDNSSVMATGVSVSINFSSTDLQIVEDGGASVSGNIITWTIGNIDPGKNATLKLQFRVLNNATVNLTANATSSVSEPDISNNYAESFVDAVTFRRLTDLQQLIDSHTSTLYPLELTDNYAYDYLDPDDVANFNTYTGVIINKTISIVDYTSTSIVSGAGKVKIFNITSEGENVNFRGLTFLSGRSNRGAAITDYGNGLMVINCTFEGNVVDGDYGGAIFIGANNSQILDSFFENNNVSQSGGAIGTDGAYNVVIRNNTFTHNYVPSTTKFGGALGFINSDTINANYNVFIDNRAREGYGAAIYSESVTNYNINDNWFGKNNPDWTALVAGALPTSWVVLRYEITAGYVSTADTRASWYSYNNITKRYTKLGTQLPERNITFATNNSAALPGGVLNPDRNTIVDEVNVAYWYPPYTSLFYMNATVDNQTVDLVWNTVLNITKTVDRNVSVAGDDVYFNLTVTNWGPNVAYNVTVREFVPSGFTMVNASVNGDSYSQMGNVFVYIIPAIGPDSNYTIPIIMRTTTNGTFTNRMNQTQWDPYNWFVETDSYVNHTAVPGVDLRIEVTNASTYVEANYDIYVTLRNLGPCVAYNVTGYFMIPQNFTYIGHWGHSWSGLSNWGTYDQTTGWWTGIDYINPGGYATIRIRTNPTTLGLFNTTANVTSIVNETKLANNYLNLSYYVTDNTDLELTVTPRVNGYVNNTPFYKATVVLEYFIKNYGPAPATDVVVNITLPAGLTYLYDYGATGGSSYNNTTGIWDVGRVESVGTNYKRIYIVCSADELGNWTIYSNASESRNDTNLSNNYVETNITINPYADLRIYLTANETYPSYDSTNMRNFTYTITIFNAGLNNASNVNVSFPIPTGLVYLDHTFGVNYTSSTGIWNVGDLLVNETQELNITVGVNILGNVTAHANITGSEIDPWLNNNYVNLTRRTRNLADLSVVVTTNLTTIWNGTDFIYEGNDGDNVTFTITVTNWGPMDAIDVNVTHYLYDLGFIDCDANGTYSLYGKNVRWNLGNITAGGSVVVHFNATITKPIEDYVINNATLTSDNNEVNETNNVDVTVIHVLHFVDLEVNITISNDTPAFHDLIYLNVTVINHGPSIAVNTTVNITLPAGLTYVTSTDLIKYNPTTGLWTIGLLNNTGPNNITKLRITLNVTDIGEMNITAVVNNSVNETNPSNNNMTINLTSHPSADLLVIITDNIVGDIDMGKDFLIFVNVTNKGPSNATNVAVSIPIPSGLVVLNDNSSGAYNNLTGIWTIGNMQAGENRILKINVTSTYAATYVIVANITGNESDPVPSNNVDNLTIVITPVFDLRINVTSTRYKTPVNESVIFTVTLYNDGPCNATNITVSGLFDPSFTVSPTSWTFANLYPGDSISFNVTVIPTELGVFFSRFNATAYGHDINLTNNNATIPVNVTYLIDLLITVIVDNPTPVVGGNVTYLITVSNKLTTDAHDTFVYLPIPTSNLTYLEHFLASGAYDPSTGIWSIGTLGGGNSTSLLLTTQVITEGTTILNGTVEAAEFDNYTGDNEDYATINAMNGTLPGTIDLDLVLSVNNATPGIGEYVIFTANVTNIGLANATGVKVKFEIPAGYTDVSTSSTFYVGDTWYVGNLKVGDSAILNITAKPISTSNLTIIGNASGNEIDSNLTNNIDNITISPVQSSDIEVNITVNDTNPYMDDEITFTITVTNIGYCNDTNVEVNVTVPPSPYYTYSTGTFYSPATGQWMIGTVNVGETKELNITLNVSSLAVGNHTFNATGNGSVYETNYTNNYDEVNLTVRAPTDILVDIDANTTLIYAGDSINFTVTVQNIGLGPAEDVFVQLDFPASVDYITSKGLFDTNKSLWSVGNLSVGETQTLNVILTINDVGSFIFTANGTTSTLDKNLTNNNDSFNLTVKPGFDLTIKLEVINNTVVMNEGFTFTITVNNTGIGIAENVKVDTGIIGTQTSITKGTYSNLTKIWDIGNVTPGEVLILNITYIPTTVGTYTFTSNVSSTEYERNLTNNIANITITVINAVDLNVSITVDNSTPSLGQTIVYNITVTNNGVNTATSVFANTNIKGVTSVSSSTGFINFMGDAVWYIPSINPGTAYSALLYVPATPAGISVKEVKVNSTETELNITDNYANITINVSTDTDLWVTINVSNTTPYVGDIVNFTIHVSNIGLVNATNVEATTNLPPAVSYTLTDGLYNPLNGVWLIDNLPNGTDAYLNVSVNITALGFQVYNVTVNMTNNDTNLTNNYDEVNLTSVSVVDLEISIIGNTSFYIGNTTTFTILVVNNGPNDATGVSVTLNLPGDSFSPSAGSYAAGTWTIGNLNKGNNATLTITRTIQLTDNGTYIANVSGNEFEFITNNNNASINLTVKPVVDLNISITTPATSYIYGDEVVYTIIVNNNGPCNITGANVTLDLPIGYIRTFNMSSNGVYINNTTWIIGNLNIGMPATLVIRGTINQTGNLTSTATVVPNVKELNEVDNTANCTYVVDPAADLSINMTLIPGIFNPDGTIGFIVNIVNLGPTKANNVSVNVSFPVTFDYNSTIGYFDSANGVWFIPELDVNSPQTLKVNLNLTNFTVTFYSNISSDILDQNMSNNYANISIDLLPLADLKVTITVNDTTPSLGQNVTFTINVTNLGPCLADDVFVYVDLPTSINYTESKGLFDTLNGTWDVGLLLPGESEVLNVVIEMNTLGTVTYHTNTTGNVNDTDMTNNNDSVTLNVLPVTDIEVIITSNASNIYVGDIVEFNVTVINHGTNADNVTTHLYLPAGISLPPTIIFSAPPAGFNMFTYVWDINNLLGGTNQTATIRATITSNGTFNISASSNGTLVDTNLTNNNATLYYNVSSVIDLQINITSTNITQFVGEDVTFTVTVTNIGLHTATNVYVNTTLPKGTSTKTDGIFDADTGLWYIGTITPGQVLELNITVKNNITGPVTYTAEVKTDNKDANYADNNASILFTGLNSTDLSITVSVNDDHPYLDDIINYTITVKNNGINIAQNVEINTSLPSTGFEFIASDPGYNNLTGIWTIGSINPGDTVKVTFTYKTNVSGTFTSNFTVNTTTYDLNLTNNFANITIDVNTSVRPNNNFVDLIVNLTVNNTNPDINSTVYFTITVYNNASITAHNVTIINTLPAGFVNVTPYGNVSAGVWEIDQIAPTTSISFGFAANITSYGSFVDNVTVSSIELDRIPVDNRANVLIVIGSSSVDSVDLGINITQVSTNLTLNGTITYNITVTNYGPNNVNSANASIVFDNGLIIDNYTEEQGTFNPTTGLWTIGNITVNTNVSMLVTLNITRYGYFVNTFSTWSEYVDSNALNNNMLDMFQVNNTLVDIGIRIKTNTTAPMMNDTIDFIVTVYNSGLIPATNVTVNITWPENITDINITSTAYNNTTNTLYIGDLSNGTSVTFTFTGKINTTTPTTIKVSVNSTEEDRYLNNNEDNITIVCRDAGAAYSDLAINTLELPVAGDTVFPEYGSVLFFRINFTNKGPDTAHNVYVKLEIPGVCELMSSTITSLTVEGFDPVNKTLFFSSFPVNHTEQLDFSIIVNQTDNFILNATIVGDEIDTKPLDNVASIGISPKVTPKDVDLEVDVTSTASIVKINTTAVFEISVKNNGNDKAYNVSVDNLLPDGFVVIGNKSITNASLVFNGTGWFIPSITGGGLKVFKFNVTAKLTQGGVFVFTSNANCTMEDKDPSNNVKSVGLYVTVPSGSATNVSTSLIVDMSTVLDAGTPASQNKSTITGGRDYQVKLVRNDTGAGISGQTVTLLLNSTQAGSTPIYITAVTDVNGIATFHVPNADLNAQRTRYHNKNVYFTVFFDGMEEGDNNYLASSSNTFRFKPYWTGT